MSDNKLESIYDFMPQEFCNLLKIYDHLEKNPNFKFSDFLTDVYVSSYMSVHKNGRAYERALFDFKYEYSKEILAAMSDNAIKEFYGIAMVSTMYVATVLKPELRLQPNELITQSMIDTWDNTLSRSSPLYELRKAIDERLKNKSNFNDFFTSGYSHVFKIKLELEILNEMKKRNLFHDNTFKVVNETSALKMLSENVSILNDYSSYIKIDKKTLEDSFLMLAELNFRKHIKKLSGLINQENPVVKINSEIVNVSTVLASVWAACKKHKGVELLEWLNESMQTTLNVIDELGDKNVVINKKPLNIINNAIFKDSLKSDFTKDYFFVKKINEVQKFWKNVNIFPLEIVDSFIEPELMKKIYGKDYMPKENEANILKVKREDFNSFYLSKGKRAPEAVSANKMFLSGFITDVKNSDKVVFKKTLQNVKSAQNLDYFYIVLYNNDNIPKEDFDKFSEIVFRELVDCNKTTKPSLEIIDSQYENYLMNKDIKNKFSKPNIRKF